tara:strand:- start:13 stop:129 length:117 start_codon:yes stop_codon:yes gene_type:complete
MIENNMINVNDVPFRLFYVNEDVVILIKAAVEGEESEE